MIIFLQSGTVEEAGASSEVETSSKSEEEITEGNAGEAEAPGRMPTMPTKMPAPNLLNDEDPRRGNIFTNHQLHSHGESCLNFNLFKKYKEIFPPESQDLDKLTEKMNSLFESTTRFLANMREYLYEVKEKKEREREKEKGQKSF